MNADLPDDVRHWPDDPYELLGITTTTDSRSVRQAYTRLIRRFKPEHAPEQFRRIREAYETVLRHRALEFREPLCPLRRLMPTRLTPIRLT